METDLGNYLFAWAEAFERIEHGLHRRHAARVEREPAGPGDDLWAQTFDWLAPEPSLAHLNADTKGDFLAAAAQVLDCEKPCSEPLMRCLHAARLLPRARWRSCSCGATRSC